jgi:putative flippase GtrA
MKKFLLSIIDWFYPPFKKIMPLQTFRYAACGGGNTLLDICIFSISYNYLLHQQPVPMPFSILGINTMDPVTASLFLAFCVSFPTGFALMRYLVYPESNLKGRVQLFRYLVQVLLCIALNYYICKVFLVDVLHIWPTLAKIITTFIVVTFSFLAQRHFTFRVKDHTMTIEDSVQEEAAREASGK